MRNKYTQYRKRLIGIILLLQASFIFNYDDLDFSSINFTQPDNETKVIEELEDYAKQFIKEDNGIFDTNECLVSKSEAKKILKEKYKIELKKDPDVNVRYILGKCSPVVFISGIYATRLVVSVNCKKLKENEPKHFMETRVFCGESICKDPNKEYEEHVLWPVVLGSPFTLISTENNKYSTCLAYFLQFFNNKEECPVNGDGPVCEYSDYIRVTFYGGTDKTVKESTCGLRAVRNILSTGSKLVDEAIGFGATKMYGEMITKFKRMGYREGFSMAGVPQDYRIFAATNKFVENAYKYQIEQLYNNTGKKVVIIAHSFGCLSTLSNLMKMDPSITSKIRKFIAVAPPFAGADELVDVFMNGMHGFDFEIKIGKWEIFKVNYDVFGQYMLYKAIPIITELRPQPFINELFTSEKYKEFGDAVLERINLENECESKNCDASYVKEHSAKFNKIFGENTFPSFSDDVCKIDNSFSYFLGVPAKAAVEEEESNGYYSTPCRAHLDKEGTCPTILLKTKDFNPTAETFEKMCGVYNASTLYNAKCDDPKIPCIDKEVYSNGNYAFDDKEKFNYIINRFNKKYASEFNQTIDASFFETKEVSRRKTESLVEYQTNISLTKELTIPPVDTTVVYANYIPTSTSFIWDREANQFSEVVHKGGDGTVPNWSSYLVGLKWLYDAKVKKLPQKINLVEYCSLLEGTKYGYDSSNPDKDFFGIGCDCLKNGKYKSGCDHAPMMNDDKLIDYVKTVIYYKNDPEEHFDEKKEALGRYDFNKDYDLTCSYKLKEFVDLEKMKD